jgi:hypothetical protein
MPQRKGKSSGRKMAITILLGVFIAIMLTIFVNLLVSYVYAGPEWDKFCPQLRGFDSQFPGKVIPGTSITANCTFNKPLNDLAENCNLGGGQPLYEYNTQGCAVSLKNCDTCSEQFEEASKAYNRKVFFIYAIIGFALIVYGLFAASLLLEIVALPSGAFLVIEAATRNFDDKLFVIITFGLLIAAALYLALRKFKLK